jgi:hypothetical protein
MLKFSERDFPALVSAKADSDRSAADKATKERRRNATEAVATINDLPEELHLCILYYLPALDQEDFQLESLISLSRTNRHFRRLTIAKIYASYNSHFCEPYLFLRTVSNNTDLGSLVKHANITYGTRAHRKRQRYTANAQDKKIIKEGLKALGISNWKDLASQCNTKPVELDTLHTAILMHTPNISSLAIRDGQDQTLQRMKSPKWIDLVRKTNLGTPDIGRVHRFKQLHTLRVEISRLSLAQLAPIFRIASLRKLYLYHLSDAYDGRNRAEQLFQQIIPPRCNDLEELHIERSFRQNDILGAVLASARSLKVLAYDLASENTSWNMDDEDLGPTKLITALRCQKTSLERFSLPYDSYAEDYFGNVTNLYEGLKDFSAMKHLNCPLANILDVSSNQNMPLSEKLPPSLATFHATISLPLRASHAKGIVLALEQLAADSAIQTPLLTQVHIEAGFRTGCDWPRVVAAFSRTSVDFAVREGYPYKSPVSPQSPTYSQDSLATDVETESESSGEVSLYSN